MNEKFGLNDLNILLEEKIEIEKILFPSVNKVLKSNEGIEYTYDNNEKFEGRMEGRRLMKLGKYFWPNGQIYKGDFINNNIHRGEIIFYPSNNKLTGTYNESQETFKNCIYETNEYKYEGNIRRNKLYGNSMIKNKQNENSYSFLGKYDDGIRIGRFEIINELNGVKYKINGFYKNGKKNGNFKVYKLDNDEIIFDYNFSNDIQLISNDNINEFKKNININCIEILNKDQKLILLYSSEKTLYLYDIVEQNNLGEIELFDNGKILDILVLKDKNILISNSHNKFKLIDIKLNSKNNEIKLAQNKEIFLPNNNYTIYSLLELENNLIISSGNSHLIFWKKNFSNINLNNSINNSINNNNIINKSQQGKSLWESITDIYNDCVNSVLDLIHLDKNTEILNYTLEKIFEINTKSIYSFIEIKKNEKLNIENNNFILALAQPDEKNILILDISFNDNLISQNEIRQIDNINSIINRKNIMIYKENILYIGCIDSIKLIDINRAEIISNILLEKISYMHIYRNEFLFLGINKNRTTYNFESKLIQYKINENNNNIIPLYENFQHRHNGSIINNIIYYFQNKEYIISLGTDKKIIITDTDFKLEQKQKQKEESKKENPFEFPKFNWPFRINNSPHTIEGQLKYLNEEIY